MQPPHGPFKISTNGQVTIPAELLRRMNLSAGDSVYVATADDIEDALVVIPVEKVVRWIDAGRRAESLEEPSGDPPDPDSGGEGARPGPDTA